MSMILAGASAEAPQRYRVSVDAFLRMADSGAFPPEARIELVNGELVAMSPIGVGHAFVVTELNRRLTPQVEGRAVVCVQSSLQLSDLSLPQPDLALVRWPPERYVDRHPSASDALLVVEVADRSLAFDRDVKVPLYAREGVPEVWLMDLPHERVHVFTDPGGAGGYTESALLTGDAVLRPVNLPEVEIVIADLRLKAGQH